MNVQKLNHGSKQGFRGKLPSATKKAIKAFTIDHLKKQNRHVSSKGAVYNGLSSTLRIGGGSLTTALAIAATPKVVHDLNFMSVSAETILLTSGVGSVFVGLSRLQTDRSATGEALVKVKSYIEKLKAAGFTKRDEIIYGIKRFMNKKGGFFTSIIPNAISSRKAVKILEETQSV